MKTILKFDGEEIGTICGDRVIDISECFRLLNVSEEDQEGYALQPNLLTIEHVSDRGGKREGAGRPATGRKKRFLQATDEEWKLILKYADEVRWK